jgi:hypothetical protein
MDILSSKSTSPSVKLDNKTTNDNSSLLDTISSISPESFKLNPNPPFNNSSIPSFHKYKLISPLSPPSSSRNDLINKETEHIPLFKRPLFQPDDKQYSSSAYIHLRNSSSPIRVNS